ncbi:hypothetical protein PV325_008594 [Microctonus aethiopoides]|nr:hypothetical protein PV325_008594 [Microctonus aethiopoides]KAK0089416.1 hypothetical protein PV326_004500 [Microctonus aethiopoides]
MSSYILEKDRNNIPNDRVTDRTRAKTTLNGFPIGPTGQMERELCTWLKCHKGAEKNLKNNQSAEEIQWKSANGISEIKHQKLLEYNWRDLIRVVYLRVHCVVDNLMQKFSFLRMHDD